VQEKLRLLHNAMAARVRAGKISRHQFDQWLVRQWEPRQRLVTEAILQERRRLKGQATDYNPRWEPDPEADVEIG